MMKIDIDFIQEELKYRILDTQKSFDETEDDYFLGKNKAYAAILALIDQQIKFEKGDYIV